MLRMLTTTLLTATLAAGLPAQGTGTAHDEHALIQNAMSAAPASIAEKATIVGHDQKVLREGTNGWVCLPDPPDLPNNSPMCLDAQWQGWMDAFMNKRTPQVTAIGFSYMLQQDMPVSNTDPFATGPTADNQWLEDAGPHIMILVPDARMLEGISTDPNNGGPWVMWKGTPYAHIMVPTAPRNAGSR